MSFNKLGITADVVRTALPAGIALGMEQLGKRIPATARAYAFVPQGGIPFLLITNTLRKAGSYAMNRHFPLDKDNVSYPLTREILREGVVLAAAGIIVTYLSPYIKVGSFALGNISGQDAVKWLALIATLEGGIALCKTLSSKRKNQPNNTGASQTISSSGGNKSAVSFHRNGLDTEHKSGRTTNTDEKADNTSLARQSASPPPAAPSAPVNSIAGRTTPTPVINTFAVRTVEATFEDTKRKLEDIFKERGVEEFTSFQQTYPKEYQEWRERTEDSLFELAIEYNNIKLVRYFAQTESLYDEGDEDRPTDLQLAVGFGDLETINIIARRGLRKNAIDDRGRNMMHYAASSGKIEVVKLVSFWNYLEGFRKAYWHISFPEAFCAAESGSLECLKYMLSHPPSTLPFQIRRPKGPFEQHSFNYHTNDCADPLKHDSTHGTILKYGVLSGKKHVVKFLIKKGVDPLKSEHYTYPIHEAAEEGFFDIVKYLWPIYKAKGMKIDDFPENGTLLFRAVRNGANIELIKYLISQGASITCQNGLKRNTLSLINDPKYQNREIKDYILSLMMDID